MERLQNAKGAFGKKKNIGTAKIGILGKEMCNNTAQAEAFT